jgi:catechol-2,3-dioxygenase
MVTVPFTAIGHVQLAMPPEKTARHFYRDLLGMANPFGKRLTRD